MKSDDYKVFKLQKFVQSVYTVFPFDSVFSVSIANMKIPSHLVEFIQVYVDLFCCYDYQLNLYFFYSRQIN